MTVLSLGKMNRKLTQEEYDNLWYTPYARIFKLRHFKVEPPAGELSFDGPFYSPRMTTLTLESVCSIKAAFVIEPSLPERFVVSPKSGVVEPGGVVVVRIVMPPNVVNETLRGRHTVTLNSVVVIEEVKLSLIGKRWLKLQPHNIHEETWLCKYDVPHRPVDKTGFYDCQYLPLPPPRPEVTSLAKVGIKEADALRKQNQEMSFNVRILRNEREYPIQYQLPPSRYETLENNLEGLFQLMGMNVHHLFVSDVRLAILYFEIGLFVLGILVGKLFF